VNWHQLLQALQKHVGVGQITTYGNCSQWAFGHTGGCPSVVAMLNAAANNGHQQWTNRVVRDDGDIAPEPDLAYGQSAQLLGEGVPFTPQGHVDLATLPAVVF
jgi:alkylated DNA nucleotide flippase Atl1